MMFNGLLMCPDSDTSEFTKGSIGSSGGETGGEGVGAWDADARAQYYHNKLLSTLQVLENREETVRVQGESLRVAEARIAKLSARADKLRAQLDDRANELRSLRLDKSKAERADVSSSTEAQELRQQKALVRCLQTNLSIIEDLYRECFYETIKQEEMIERLRECYLEVRHARAPPTLGPQDIATEVDSLKLDINNFLNNSNNDSVDCTCGLVEENMRLKNINETLQIQLGESRQRVSELEAIVAEKEDTAQLKKEIEDKNNELEKMKELMTHLEESVREKNTVSEIFSRQLQQSQVSLEDQSVQLSEARRRAASLQDELRRATQLAEQSRVSCEEARAREAASAREARALRAELTRARTHARQQDKAHREQTQVALSLQAQLEQAQSRGAQLCAEVRAAVAAVHAWLRRHRDQETKIKDQELIIKSLEHRLQSSHIEDIMQPNNDTCCPNCVSVRRRRCRARENETASCSKCTSMGERRRECSGTSGSEMPSPPAPTPPDRLVKKTLPCTVTDWWPPRRRPAARTLPDRSRSRSRLPSSWELEQRMRSLRTTLEQSQARWTHAHRR